jgi:hypothetical protein
MGDGSSFFGDHVRAELLSLIRQGVREVLNSTVQSKSSVLFTTGQVAQMCNVPKKQDR